MVNQMMFPAADDAEKAEPASVETLVIRLGGLYYDVPRTAEQADAFNATAAALLEAHRNACRLAAAKPTTPAPEGTGVCWQCGAGTGALMAISSATVLFFLLHGPLLGWRAIAYRVRRLFSLVRPRG